MPYFAEIHKQITICQVAAGVLIGSGITLFISLIRLMSNDYRHLGELGWPMAVATLSGIGVVVSAKILESSLAKAELVRMSGGVDRSIA